MTCQRIHRLLLLGLLGFCMLPGCSGDGEQYADEGFTHVLTAETEYYVTGPQQARPPDGHFEAGLKVKLIEQAGSYSRVESESGVTAYVATDAFGPIEDEIGN